MLDGCVTSAIQHSFVAAFRARRLDARGWKLASAAGYRSARPAMFQDCTAAGAHPAREAAGKVARRPMRRAPVLATRRKEPSRAPSGRPIHSEPPSPRRQRRPIIEQRRILKKGECSPHRSGNGGRLSILAIPVETDKLGGQRALPRSEGPFASGE